MRRGLRRAARIQQSDTRPSNSEHMKMVHGRSGTALCCLMHLTDGGDELAVVHELNCVPPLPSWHAINEPMRPLRISKLNTIPKPCEHDGGGFAKTGWDVDELGTAGRARIVPRQTGLIGVGRVARGGLKEGVEWKPAHGSPPFRGVDARCLVMDCLSSFDVAPRPNPQCFFRGGLYPFLMAIFWNVTKKAAIPRTAD